MFIPGGSWSAKDCHRLARVLLRGHRGDYQTHDEHGAKEIRDKRQQTTDNRQERQGEQDRHNGQSGGQNTEAERKGISALQDTCCATYHHLAYLPVVVEEFCCCSSCVAWPLDAFLFDILIDSRLVCPYALWFGRLEFDSGASQAIEDWECSLPYCRRNESATKQPIGTTQQTKWKYEVRTDYKWRGV